MIDKQKNEIPSKKSRDVAQTTDDVNVRSGELDVLKRQHYFSRVMFSGNISPKYWLDQLVEDKKVGSNRASEYARVFLVDQERQGKDTSTEVYAPARLVSHWNTQTDETVKESLFKMSSQRESTGDKTEEQALAEFDSRWQAGNYSDTELAFIELHKQHRAGKDPSLEEAVAVAKSQKRETANRINAKKSCGPKTLEGKSRSSRNAEKHGFTSAKILISDADQEDFNRLKQALWPRFSPADAFEEMLFDDYVVDCWRIRRTLSMEAALLDHLSEGGNSLFRPITWLSDKDFLGKLSRYLTPQERSRLRKLNEYNQVQAARRAREASLLVDPNGSSGGPEAHP